MAEAPGHRLGQIIGDALEASIEPVLRDFVQRHEGLYLDGQGDRPARAGRKVVWTDDLGNRHDLDWVIERGGTDYEIGAPAAFIEVAWRRYTKHSKNKAQEIQGAVLPMLSKHAEVKPFIGAVVGGEWTAPALKQLRSSGFEVLYITFGEIVAAFASEGIDVRTAEGTPDEYLQEQVDKYEALGEDAEDRLGAALRAAAPDDFEQFMLALAASVARRVERVVVVPLHGASTECSTVGEAIDFIRGYDKHADRDAPFVRFEVLIRFDNGDRIEAQFQEAANATAFLRSFG